MVNMVLYTPLHHEEIFPNEEKANELKSYAGRQCYVKKQSDGSYELVRLLSTNPQDFLRNEFQPGSKLKF